MSQHSLRDIVCTLGWFGALVVVSLLLEDPIQFIVPYALPVIALTWNHNIRWGLAAAAGATLAAAAGGALPSNDYVTLVEDGLYAYAQFSAMALGISLGSFSHRRLTGEQ